MDAFWVFVIFLLIIDAVLIIVALKDIWFGLLANDDDYDYGGVTPFLLNNMKNENE